MTNKKPVDFERRKKIYKKLGLKTVWDQKSGCIILFCARKEQEK